VRVGYQGRILTTADPGFVTAGQWTSLVRAAASPAVQTAGNGSATWTFSGLRPGTYRVSATWQPSRTAGEAVYTVRDNQQTLGTAAVNQHPPPADFRDAGRAWKDLGQTGGVYRLAGTTLSVQMAGHNAQFRGPLTADSIRVERFDNPSI